MGLELGTPNCKSNVVTPVQRCLLCLKNAVEVWSYNAWSVSKSSGVTFRKRETLTAVLCGKPSGIAIQVKIF